MDSVEIKNVAKIEVQSIGETIDSAWRTILVTTADGKVVELILVSTDPDTLRIAL